MPDLQKTLDDPKFADLDPAVQRSVLTKLGVSSDRQTKILDKLTGQKAGRAAARAGTLVPSHTPAVPPDFFARAAQRMKGGLKSTFVDLPEAVNEAINKIASGTPPTPEGRARVRPFGEGPVRTPLGAVALPWIQMGKAAQEYYRDPAALVGDVAAGAVLGKIAEPLAGERAGVRTGTRTAELPERQLPGTLTREEQARLALPSNFPRPPLTPEEQIAFTESLDKANRTYQTAASKYHEKVTQNFEDAKREQLAHDQKVADAAEKSRQNVQEYTRKLDETYDSITRQQLRTSMAYEKARGEWLEETRVYQEAKAQAEMNAEHKLSLERGSREQVGRAYRNLQDTYAAGRADLNGQWEALRGEMKGMYVPGPEDIYSGIRAAEKEFLRGSPQSLQQFRNLIKEMGIEEYVDEAGGLKPTEKAGAEPPPLEWQTARVHYSAINDRLAAGNLPGNVYKALESVRDLLDDKLTQTADIKQLGSKYQATKALEHQFLSDWRDPGSPLAKAHKALDPNFLEPRVLGRGNQYIAGQLSRWTQYGADPNLIVSAKLMAEEAKTVPKVKVPSAPGPAPVRPEGIPDYVLPPEPEVVEVEPLRMRDRPVPEAPELEEVMLPSHARAPEVPGWLRSAGRTGGKVVGVAAGQAVGHPWIGYGMGGEIGEAATRSWWRRRLSRLSRLRGSQPPPPPSP